MVTRYGMNELVGPVSIDLDDPGLSSDTKRLVETEVQKLLSESYARTQQTLKKYAREHHLIANALLDHETLTGDELRQLVPRVFQDRLVTGTGLEP